MQNRKLDVSRDQRLDVCEMQDVTSGFMFAPLKNLDNKV